MNNNIITEIAQFKTIDGITEDKFINIIDSLEINYHINQKGYIDTELIKGKEDNKWIMIQHWRTKEEAHEASKNFSQSEFTEEFRKSLDPKSVNLYFTERIKYWNN